MEESKRGSAPAPGHRPWSAGRASPGLLLAAGAAGVAAAAGGLAWGSLNDFPLLPTGTADACPDLGIPAAAFPLDRIPLPGTWEEWEGWNAELRPVEAPEPALPLPIVLDEEGPFLPAPAHNSGRIEGGEVRFLLRRDAQECGPFPLRILPLEPASGALECTVEAMEALLRVAARGFGIGREDLRTGSPRGVPPQAVPLLAAGYLLDHPENPNSARAFLEGSAEAQVEVSERCRCWFEASWSGPVSGTERGEVITEWFEPRGTELGVDLAWPGPVPGAPGTYEIPWAEVRLSTSEYMVGGEIVRSPLRMDGDGTLVLESVSDAGVVGRIQLTVPVVGQWIPLDPWVESPRGTLRLDAWFFRPRPAGPGPPCPEW